MRRQGGQGKMGVMLLGFYLARYGIHKIPPVTLGIIGLNVSIFLGLVGKGLRAASTCVSYDNIVWENEFQRLLLAAFYHLDDWHLYYNMMSTLWKGRKLEKKFGSPYFAYVTVVFSVLTSLTMVAINRVMAEAMDDRSHLYTCAAGFSGVLFAYKVLTTYYSDDREYIMGFAVPAKYACWAELLLIQVMMPRVSFSGHLAGILVGLAYVKGPLRFVMDMLIPKYEDAQRPSFGDSDLVSRHHWCQDGTFPTNGYLLNDNRSSQTARAEDVRPFWGRGQATGGGGPSGNGPWMGGGSARNNLYPDLNGGPSASRSAYSYQRPPSYTSATGSGRSSDVDPYAADDQNQTDDADLQQAIRNSLAPGGSSYGPKEPTAPPASADEFRRPPSTSYSDPPSAPPTFVRTGPPSHDPPPYPGGPEQTTPYPSSFSDSLFPRQQNHAAAPSSGNAHPNPQLPLHHTDQGRFATHNSDAGNAAAGRGIGFEHLESDLTRLRRARLNRLDTDSK